MKKTLAIVCIMVILAILTFILFADSTNGQLLTTNISASTIDNMRKSDQSFAVYFYQKSCPSCQQAKGIINSYLEKSEKMVIYSMDINREEDKEYLISTLNIQGSPTVIFFKRGREVKRFSTLFSLEELSINMNEIISSNAD